MKLWPPLALAAMLAFSGMAFAKNIVETAKASGQFTILLKAATAAGMDRTLAQPGPYTVFAPTDAAFNALPPGMLDMLMKPQNKAMLKKILGYHTLFGRLTTRQLTAPASAVTTTIGALVVLQMKNGALMVNDAKITQPDIAADNGVIQVIDTVLMPATPVQPST
ncbi:MAG: fasciclin domain-containing protein [Pseudomonadota bacterium]|nr:fasciclin domain-containing protein [Pseudomonadota bacterium]